MPKNVDIHELQKRLENEEVHAIAASFGVSTVTLAAFCHKHNLIWPGAKRPAPRKAKVVKGPPSKVTPQAPHSLPEIPLPKKGEGAIRLTRQTLYDLVWSHSTLELAAAWQRSDVSIAKICKAQAIPKPSLGEWAKMKAGHAVPRPPLPRKEYDEKPSIILKVPPAARFTAKVRKAEPQSREVIEKIPVPEVLIEPHPLVLKTQKALERAKTGERGLLSARGKGIIPVVVGPDSVERVLRLLDALLKNLESKGLKVTIKVDEKLIHEGYYDSFRGKQIPPKYTVVNTPQVHVDQEVITFSIEERSKRKLRTEPSNDLQERPVYSDEKGAYDLVPNGILHFHIETPYYFLKGHWYDRRSHTLEVYLGEIVNGFKRMADEVRLKREEDAEAARRREEEETRRREAIRQQEIEQNRREQFFADLSRWRIVEDARAFIAAAKGKVAETPNAVTEETRQWLTWSESLVAKLDPLSPSLPTLSDYDTKRKPHQPDYLSPQYRTGVQEVEMPKQYPFWLRGKR